MDNSGRFLALALLASLSFSLGPLFPEATGAISCDHGCIEGHDATLSLNLQASQEWVYVYEMKLVDEDGKQLCRKPYNKNITSGTISFSCSFELPEAQPAFMMDVVMKYSCPSSPEQVDGTEWSTSLEVKQPECTRDSQCGEEYICEQDSCTLLQCPPGFPAEGHECQGYECETDSDCGTDASCIHNECFEHNCDTDDDCPELMQCNGFDCVQTYCQYSNQKPINHTCVEAECESDSDCAYDGYCMDYQCLALGCENAKAYNHTCIPYECGNNSDCVDGEFCAGFFCEKVECPEGHIPSSHNCVECLSDSDCSETRHCSGNICAPVSCSGTVVAHECVIAEPSPIVSQGNSEPEPISQESSPQQTETNSSGGCASLFILLIAGFGVFAKSAN